MREKRPRFEITLMPVVIGALGDGLKKAINNVLRILPKREVVFQTVAEMQKTILMGTKTIM